MIKKVSRIAPRNSKGVHTSKRTANMKPKKRTGASVATFIDTPTRSTADVLSFKSPEGNRISVSYELVSPQTADNWLKLNTRNRMLDERLVKSLVKKMKKNHWMFNGDTIRFSEKFKQEGGVNQEVLMDGQNRLNSIVQSGIPQYCLVVRGLNAEAFATMDDGRKRSASDILSIAKISEPRKKAGIAKTAILLQGGYYGSTKGGGDRSVTPGNLEILDFVRENDEKLDDAILHANDVKTHFPYLNFKILSSMFHVFSKHGKQEARDFYSELSAGKKAKTAVVRLFCSELIKNDAREHKLPYNTILAYFIKTWNAYKEGDKLEKLSYDKTEEKFPKPI